MRRLPAWRPSARLLRGRDFTDADVPSTNASSEEIAVINETLAARLFRSVQSLLFGVGTIDPTSAGVAVMAMTVTAVFASYLPARRASRVDPIAALRAE